MTNLRVLLQSREFSIAVEPQVNISHLGSDFCDEGLSNNREFLSISNLSGKPALFIIIVFAVLTSGMVSFNLAFGLSEEQPAGCGIFDYNEQCNLSPIAHLIYGDVIIAGSLSTFLALLFHHLTHRSMLKIDNVIQRVDKIIQSQESLNNRRKDYAVEHVKSMLSLVIFAMSMMRASVNRYNEAKTLKDKEDQKWMQSTTLSQLRGEESRLGRLLQNVRTILTATNDVIDPDVVSRIWGVCNYIAGIEVAQKADGTVEFPKYIVCRRKLEYLLQFLQSYTQTTHSFNEIEERYESSAISPEPGEAQEVPQ